MTIYKLVNPSDPYTLEADSNLIADLAGLFIGNGKTPVEGVDNGFRGFMDLFGTTTEAELQFYFAKTHKYDFSLLMSDKVVLTKLAEALESLFLGDVEDREKLIEMTDDVKADFIKENRSSMTDYYPYAKRLANTIKGNLKNVDIVEVRASETEVKKDEVIS